MSLSRTTFGLALLLCAACTAVSDGLMPGTRSDGLSEEELREDLVLFANEFTAIVGAASEDIRQASSSRAVRRRTLLWRMALDAPIQEAAFIDDPQEAYASTLALVVMMRQYFVDGDGREVFEEHQPVAVGAARTLETAILDIGRQFLDAEQLADVRSQIDELARRHPIRGASFALESRGSIAEDTEVVAGLGWLFDVPMAPFKALQGVGSTPAAVREFNATARKFGEIVADLPRKMRWQTELLLYDIEDRQTTVESLAAMQKLADSIERTSHALEAALQGSDAEFEGLQAVLADARTLAEELGPTAADLRAGSEAWERIMLAPDDGASSEERPFDIREWEAAAREIGTAAAELRGLVESQEAVMATLDRTQAGGRDLVDHAAWRAFQVLAAFVGLLLVSRVIASRLAPRRQGGG